MLKNHLKIAWRNLRRNSLFSLINVLGLSIGLASTFLIFFWVTDEMSVDKFHENNDRLYQVMMRSEENGIVKIHDGTQGPLAEALEKDLPEVENAVTVMNLQEVGMSITFSAGENNFKTQGLFASSNFFDVFSFPLVYGDASQVLNKKEAVVVSESFAVKLFGSVEKAINSPIEYFMFGQNQTAQISGVFKDTPDNSTMKFSFVATKQKLLEDMWTNGKEWGNTGPNTYITLKDNSDVKAFESKIDRFVDKYNEGNMFSLFLRKYADTYLYGNYKDGIQTGGRITYIKLFSFIGLLVLLIACINFMNLSTARVTKRFKEIGIKKTVGGTKNHLVVQFLTESLFLALLSLIVAMLLIVFLMPVFNFITGKNLGLTLIFEHLGVLTLATIITGLIAGSYPAFYLSRFSPLATLKGKFKSKGGELLARKGLVVFQFTASLILIIAVLIISDQINYAINKPIGYQKGHMVQIDLEGKAFEQSSSFFDEIEKVDGVESVGAISESIISEDGGSSTYGIDWAGKPDNLEIDFVFRNVNHNLVQTMNIQMADGDTFSKEMGDLESYLLFNEEAIRLMGLQNPVGKKVRLWGEEKVILGVMKNFHTASVLHSISPVVFRCSPMGHSLAMVRVKSGEEANTLASMNEVFEKFNPGYDFSYTFQDQAYNLQYLTEQRILSLSRYFAILAIFISCLGLFGLAAFNTETRIKEIGIRKVLGSSTYQILSLLSSDFMRLIGLSILLGLPIAYYVMSDWLLKFEYRVDISWSSFFLSSILTVAVALITISFQALKAAHANPVKSLRTE
ncbi:ABC transporter permease [Euzebyella marina]|uniref:ABC transporter permease n=1 Tax=Euzebyella marina TaxID=1761453 RepID=A0A3G2LAT7_9FLAO|nr:ABC transporter permease [Euzebyella marina]AYN69386.1 ABC transporter permease [Euzebyella marina]